MRKLYLLIVAAALAACASEPSQQAAPASTSISPAPAAEPAAVAAPAPVAASVPVTTASAEAPATSGGFNAPAGYQKKTRGTKTVYCKSDTPVGTRFSKEYCYSQQDLERIEASRTNTMQEVERARRTCTGGGCGGG